MELAVRADRFAGSLLAQALGDALGFVVEGQPAPVCAPYAAPLRAGRLVPRAAREGFTPGQYSDDTQLARLLAESLVARRGFDAADYAARIAALFAEGAVVGHGPSTEAAARRLAAGVPWHEAGTPGPVAGNGGAMRVGPLALWLAHDPAALAQAAREQARITHADPRCGAGAVALAVVIAAAVARPEASVEALCLAAARATEPLDGVLAAAVAELPRWLPVPEAEAAPVLAAVGLPPHGDSGRFGIAPHVTPSVLWSLYAALRHRDDLGAALATAIAVGGDVDTTAAMTGAVVGARLGAAALPAATLAPLHDRGAHGAEALRGLGQALAALSR